MFYQSNATFDRDQSRSLESISALPISKNFEAQKGTKNKYYNVKEDRHVINLYKINKLYREFNSCFDGIDFVKVQKENLSSRA
jgi:hypothetical protein